MTVEGLVTAFSQEFQSVYINGVLKAGIAKSAKRAHVRQIDRNEIIVSSSLEMELSRAARGGHRALQRETGVQFLSEA